MKKSSPPPKLFSLSDRQNDIIFAEFTQPLNLDLAIMQDVLARLRSFTANRKHYLVKDVSKVRSITTEARQYFQQRKNSPNTLAIAFVASTPVSKLIANILTKSATHFKAQVFSDKRSALQWIYEVRLNNLPNA